MKVATITLTVALLGLSGCPGDPPPQPAADPPRPSTDPSVPFPAWQLPPSANEPPPAPQPRTMGDLAPDATGSRCPERLRVQLPIFDGTERVALHAVPDALALPGAISVERGRHRGQPGLPLVALVDDASTLEVWPCRGETLVWSAAELQADPTRYLLVLSGKGTLKLLDTRREGPSPVSKNLAAVRRLR